jgi:hypothetical protein
MVAYLHGFTYAFADATHRGQRWRVLETPQLPDTILSTLDVELHRRNLIAASVLNQLEESNMSKEQPKDDPRQATDWKNTKQTDEPWKGPTEKEQKSDGSSLDLEKWQETNTH